MADRLTRVLLDTSVLIADAGAAPLAADQSAAISIISLGELRAGVALAADPRIRAARQARIADIKASFLPIAVDATVAEWYGDILAVARSQHRITKATDLLIIATAVATGRLLMTLDSAQARLASVVGAACEAAYEPNGEGHCMMVTFPAGVAQSVRAAES